MDGAQEIPSPGNTLQGPGNSARDNPLCSSEIGFGFLFREVSLYRQGQSTLEKPFPFCVGDRWECSFAIFFFLPTGLYPMPTVLALVVLLVGTRREPNIVAIRDALFDCSLHTVQLEMLSLQVQYAQYEQMAYT